MPTKPRATKATTPDAPETADQPDGGPDVPPADPEADSGTPTAPGEPLTDARTEGYEGVRTDTTPLDAYTIAGVNASDQAAEADRAAVEAPADAAKTDTKGA